jgi:hypothetical protein
MISKKLKKFDYNLDIQEVTPDWECENTSSYLELLQVLLPWYFITMK